MQTDPLPDLSFANIFYLSVASLFILLMISFVFSVLTKSSSFVISSTNCAFSVASENPRSPGFSPASSSSHMTHVGPWSF